MHSFQNFVRAKTFTTQAQRKLFIINVRAKYDMLKSAGMIFAPPLVVPLPISFDCGPVDVGPVAATTVVADLPAWLGFTVAEAMVVSDFPA